MSYRALWQRLASAPQIDITPHDLGELWWLREGLANDSHPLSWMLPFLRLVAAMIDDDDPAIAPSELEGNDPVLEEFGFITRIRARMFCLDGKTHLFDIIVGGYLDEIRVKVDGEILCSDKLIAHSLGTF